MVETTVTESINAMYKWYHNSALCIVYLYDIDKDDPFAITDLTYSTALVRTVNLSSSLERE